MNGGSIGADLSGMTGAAAARRRKAWGAARRALEEKGGRSGPCGYTPHWRGDLPWRLMRWAVTLLVSLLGLYRRGIRNALELHLVALELSWSGLPPAFDGYRVLHLSDTHFDALPALTEALTALLDGLEVDLVVLTGDFCVGMGGAFDRLSQSIADALGAVRSRDGRLAVLGDHDPADVVEALESRDIRVLTNDSVNLDRADQRIVITGLDDVHRFYTDEAREALIAQREGFRVALVHSPEVADLAADAGYSLYLCGHTHGGQICLPGGRPIVTLLTRCRFAAAGLWRLRDMMGYTSRGIGVAAPPVRFNCRGEAVVITLRRSNDLMEQMTSTP